MAKGGSLQTAGAIVSAIGILTAGIGLIAGVALTFLGATPGALLLAGAALTIAGNFLTPLEAEKGDTRRESPTYGFNVRNPVKGDAVIPVVLAKRMQVAPVHLQAFTTPEGVDLEDDDFSKALRTRGESLSLLMAVGEGPLLIPEQILIDGRDLLGRAEEDDGGPVECQPKDSTRKVFLLPGIRPWLPTVELWIGDQNRTTLSQDKHPCDGNGTRTVWVFDIPDLATEANVTFREGGTSVEYTGATRLDPEASTGVRPYAFLTSPTRLVVNTQVPIISGRTLWVETKVRRHVYTVSPTEQYVGRVERQGNKGVIKFDAAIPPGTTVRAKFRRILFPGTTIEWRSGISTQLNIPGFDATRQTRSQNESMSTDPAGTTFTTEEPVDDVVINLSSGPNGRTYFKETDAGFKQQAVSTRFKIEWRYASEADSKYRTLQDPGNTTNNHNRFKVSGDSLSEIGWSYSVRGLINKFLDKHPNNAEAQAQRDDWRTPPTAVTDKRITFRLTRIDEKKGDTNSAYRDELLVESWTEIQDDGLIYPHTALLGLHALASKKLSGGVPTVQVVVGGLQDVESCSTVGGADVWTVDPGAASNPVWAACAMWTNKRWGAGEQFSQADIDTTSAIAAAAWCDTQVSVFEGQATPTEVQSRCDYVMDHREQLLGHMAEILTPARVIPVLQGRKLKFVIDKAVTLVDSVGADAVPTLTDVGADSDLLPDGAALAHAPVTHDATEIYLEFWDEEANYERTPIQAVPDVPATNRRIKRVEARSVTRLTEAQRYARWLYAVATHSPSIPDMTVAASVAMLAREPGDVFKFTSTRLALGTFYLRVFTTRTSFPALHVEMDCREYVPAVYGQQVNKPRILVTAPRGSAVTASPFSPAQTLAPADTSRPRRTQRTPVNRRGRVAGRTSLRRTG